MKNQVNTKFIKRRDSKKNLKNIFQAEIILILLNIAAVQIKSITKIFKLMIGLVIKIQPTMISVLSLYQNQIYQNNKSKKNDDFNHLINEIINKHFQNNTYNLEDSDSEDWIQGNLNGNLKADSNLTDNLLTIGEEESDLPFYQENFNNTYSTSKFNKSSFNNQSQQNGHKKNKQDSSVQNWSINTSLNNETNNKKKNKKKKNKNKGNQSNYVFN